MASAEQEPDLHPDQLLALLQPEAGQPENTLDEIGVVLGQRTVFTDLRSLRDRINEGQRPTSNAVVRTSTQSDKLDITQAELSQDLFFMHGRSQLRLGLQDIDYKPAVGSKLNVLAPGLTGNVRLSDTAAIAGELWSNRVDTGSAKKTITTYGVFVTLRPADSLRFDIDTSRRTFDNLRSLQMGIVARTYGGSMDYTPTSNLRLTLRASQGNFNDDNRRRSGEVEGVWRAKSEPLVEFGLRAATFSFAKQLNNGYFNPEKYVSGEAMVRVKSALSEKFTVEAAASGGIEDSNPGGSKPLVKSSIQAVYELPGRWSLDGGVSYFSSRQANSSGFSRTSIFLGLHYRL